MKYTVIKAMLMIAASVLIVVLPFLYSPNVVLSTEASAFGPKSETIVLDAGHGGEDGGAVGVGGILEKDINLSITLETGTVLRFLGYNTVLTRDSDVMTCDEGLSSQRKKKVSDIKNRLALLEKTDCAAFVSIHQNFFGGEARGAQIFYSGGNPESKALAETLQQGIVSMLQPENDRVIKQATDDIYILYHTDKIAVLAERGFISNSAEAAMLSDAEYQSKMAFSIAASVTKYLTERENT